MDEGKDLSVREATLAVLENSKDGIKEIKDICCKISNCFDTGKDREGLQMVGDELIPRIKAFFGFCKSLVDANADIFNPALQQKLVEKFKRSDEVMKSLKKESEASNFTEVGDLLRFDFSDLFSEYSALLPEIAEAFKKSTKKSLDVR